MGIIAGSSAISAVLTVLAVLVAIAATVLTAIFIMPEKKRKSLPKFFQILHDIFNFKSLLIEKILRIMYVFSTMLSIFTGFFMLFWFDVGYSYYGGSRIQWRGAAGLLVMILGPIVVRLVYEAIMMFIILVKNTVSINNKIKNQNKEPVVEETVVEVETVDEDEEITF